MHFFGSIKAMRGTVKPALELTKESASVDMFIVRERACVDLMKVAPNIWLLIFIQFLFKVVSLK